MEKIKVPRKVYEQLVVLNREVHYTLNFPLVVKMAEDRGLSAAAEWLASNEDAFKKGFARGFEPID